MTPATLLCHQTHCSFTGLGSEDPPAGVPFPRILGIEAAGIVEEAPGGEFKKGDVVATAMGGMGRQFDGGYAQYTSVPAAHVQVGPGFYCKMVHSRALLGLMQVIMMTLQLQLRGVGRSLQPVVLSICTCCAGLFAVHTTSLLFDAWRPTQPR